MGRARKWFAEGCHLSASDDPTKEIIGRPGQGQRRGVSVLGPVSIVLLITVKDECECLISLFSAASKSIQLKIDSDDELVRFHH